MLKFSAESSTAADSLCQHKQLPLCSYLTARAYVCSLFCVSISALWKNWHCVGVSMESSWALLGLWAFSCFTPYERKWVELLGSMWPGWRIESSCFVKMVVNSHLVWTQRTQRFTRNRGRMRSGRLLCDSSPIMLALASRITRSFSPHSLTRK